MGSEGHHMIDKHSKGPVAITEVAYFEHVLKGEKPRVFRSKDSAIPGDGVFAEIRVQGVRFAISCIACGGSDVAPEKFELALRSTVTALCQAVGAAQERGIEVIPDAEIH